MEALYLRFELALAAWSIQLLAKQFSIIYQSIHSLGSSIYSECLEKSKDEIQIHSFYSIQTDSSTGSILTNALQLS